MSICVLTNRLKLQYIRFIKLYFYKLHKSWVNCLTSLIVAKETYKHVHLEIILYVCVLYIYGCFFFVCFKIIGTKQRQKQNKKSKQQQQRKNGKEKR